MSYFPFKQDSAGSALVSQEGNKATYRACLTAQTSISGLNFSIYGSASKTVKILRAGFSAQITTQTTGAFRFKKYSAVPTGGAFSTPTLMQMDSGDGAASASVKQWTSAPTEGAGVDLESAVYLLKTVTALGDAIYFAEFGGKQGGKPVTLRGTSEGFGLVLGAAMAGAGGNYSVWVEWTEE